MTKEDSLKLLESNSFAFEAKKMANLYHGRSQSAFYAGIRLCKDFLRLWEQH